MNRETRQRLIVLAVQIVGVLAIAAGVGLIYVPAGLIALGLGAIVLGEFGWE